jgi:enamine deaminase RidA (YjgF/YER057c/UK114 family)
MVRPLLNPRVEHFGHTTDKQSMYNMIGKVYHSSKGEVACLVKDECFLTDTDFFGNEETMNEVSSLSNQEILNLWKKLF